jgi:two-component sensor histidine kinase/predicted hydrocarbon binding protein
VEALLNTDELLKQIEKLEKENAMLRRDFSSLEKGNTVKVPEAMKPLFDLAQKNVGDYFRELKMDPTHGTIEINDQRYILIRASALSTDFLSTMQKLYADRGEREALIIGKNFLFDIAHVIGMNDAKNFHVKMHLTDPIAKLSAGPVHFAYSGWAYVDILPESNPSIDENFYLIYNHTFSFEADSWIRSGKKSELPVCSMNAGYSSGWCEESFGIPLTAVEVMCKAKGDEHCTFIMSPPNKIQAHVERYTSISETESHKKFTYEIPTFFERKKMEEMIKEKSEELELSNKELEQFIYSASHDLQEPLRMVTIYLQLLEKRYKNKLDNEAKEFIEFAMDGSNRMRELIRALLDYSHIKTVRPLENIDLNVLLKGVIGDLKESIKESNAVITIEPLPIIFADKLLIAQLFQNLISNALKFKGERPPEIVISGKKNNNEYLFSVKDNGIGIQKEYGDKLFTIFQRLNAKEKYPGTGIGLVICKKIAEKHGGKIWFESEFGKGTTFYFTIKEKENKPIE